MASVIDAFRTILGAKHSVLKISALSLIVSFPVYQVVINWGDWTSSWAIVAYALFVFYIGYIVSLAHNMINEHDVLIPGYLNPVKIFFVGIGALMSLVPMVVLMAYVGYCLYMIGMNKAIPMPGLIALLSLVELIFFGFFTLQMVLYANKYNPLHSYKLVTLFKSFSPFVTGTIHLFLLLGLVTAFVFFPFGYLAHLMFVGNGYEYVFCLVIIYFVTLSLLIGTQFYSQMFMEDMVLCRKVEYEDDAGKIMDKDLLIDNDNDKRGRY